MENAKDTAKQTTTPRGLRVWGRRTRARRPGRVTRTEAPNVRG